LNSGLLYGSDIVFGQQENTIYINEGVIQTIEPDELFILQLEQKPAKTVLDLGYLLK
jgi:hypothetical protein